MAHNTQFKASQSISKTYDVNAGARGSVVPALPNDIQTMLESSQLTSDCKEIVSLMFRYFESKLSTLKAS